MLRTAALASAALLVLVACKSSTDPDSQTEDTFDSNTIDRYTTYSDGPSTWVFNKGTLVGTGPSNQAVLIRNGVSMTNGWVEAVTSRADDGGLVLRFQSGTNYYMLAFRDDAAPSPRGVENLAVYHHVPGAYHEMWVKNVTWTRGTSHTIRFEAAGDKLRVYFDGVLQVELTPAPTINDPAPYLGPGGVGVRNYGIDTSWISYFDTFRWHVVS